MVEVGIVSTLRDHLKGADGGGLRQLLVLSVHLTLGAVLRTPHTSAAAGPWRSEDSGRVNNHQRSNAGLS